VEDGEGLLTRFNRLMKDLENGGTSRTCFRGWEIDLLLDFQTCGLDGSDRRKILQRYQKAVQRGIEKGAQRPLKLSEYLARLPGPRQSMEIPPLGVSGAREQYAAPS
jgi:hypothetical protein